jgi:hypothetical protein
MPERMFLRGEAGRRAGLRPNRERLLRCRGLHEKESVPREANLWYWLLWGRYSQVHLPTSMRRVAGRW